MENYSEKFWRLRLESCRKALVKNHFEVFVAQTPEDARRIFLEEILPGLHVHSASWGDSLTLHATGILEEIRRNPEIELLETFDPAVPRETLIERRRQALLVDLFMTGSNALTESGQLVNLDMIGNRIGAITFGPRHVIVFAGRNKIVGTVEEAMRRIKQFAAPLNSIRHEDFNLPCASTGRCMDCQSPKRICNTWCITEKSYPKKRIKVILINGEHGL
ncbi:MAG: lactate utilization protein [Desulfobacteraceae bacterium]|nr:MAG: lactate utilization protein [Desulfobacteraceae bacterium]